MTSALDTNVLLDLLIPNPAWMSRSLQAIARAASEGGLVVCEIVFAELCGQFQSRKECDSFLEDNAIRVDASSREVLHASSTAWRSYRKQGGKRDRILPDFLVGAHARHQASRLVSRDAGFYREYFHGLAVLDPREL